MASRRKRSSHIMPRRDSQSYDPPTEDDEVNDEDERRARYLKNKQQHNHLDSPVTSQDSAHRRSIGGLSSLTPSQITDHYNNCIKLSAENKISTKNAFELQLIDYMVAMSKKKESNLSNFQIAAGTLDASTKIYACRVDAVYGETIKIASGLGQTARSDDQGKEAGGDDVEGEQGEQGGDKKARRVNKRNRATVEKNLKKTTLTQIDKELNIDILSQKIQNQVEENPGCCQFISTLEITDSGCQLLLDCEAVFDLKNNLSTPRKSECPLAPVGLPAQLPDAICPTFSGFSFTKWSLDSENDDEYQRLNESISASQEERHRELRQGDDHAFDTEAVPEPIDDDYDIGGVDCYDPEEDGVTEISERALGHVGARAAPCFTATLPMTTAEMLSALTTAPQEYSYFDQGKLGAWAGPKHWKFKPLTRHQTDEEKSKPRKKKEVVQIALPDGEQKDMDNEMLNQMEILMRKPKKAIKLIEKTIKNWSRDKGTLPEDLHYSGHELVRLEGCDQMVVASGKVTETQVDDVDDYDYDNAADMDDYCPADMDDEAGYNVDAGALGEDGAPVNTTDGEFPATQTFPDHSMDKDEYGGSNLVEAPRLVDKAALQIGYAKTAKKVDMKRIKSVTWSILTQASTEEKENIGASPEKVADKSAKESQVEEMAFSHIYTTLKRPNSRLPAKMAENLSVSLAFLALLHLCNEQNLEITQETTGLTDFIINQG